MLLKKYIFLITLGVVFLPPFLFGKPLEEVTLQLRWLHQFQFAGYYMAKEKGYYRDAGLDVTIQEANDVHPHPVDEVVSGRAQYGIGNSGLLDERSNGKPVVVLAALFQSSPNVWILRKDSGITTISELASKRLMMTKNIENAELMALFRNEGINISKLDVTESTFNINDLIDKKVDAYNGYSTNEPYYLQQQGIEYTIISPRKYGIDFYSDCLFTSDTELANHLHRVKAFREASLRGWAYALEHPQETINVILSRYSQSKTRDHLLFEANAIRHLMEPALIEIGHMNPARWEQIAKTYYDLGFSRTASVPNGFIYDHNPPKNNTWLYYLLAISFILIAIIAAVAGYIYRLNCKIKEQAIRDPLTGIYNRRYLNETLPREIARSKRDQTPLSIVMVDLDFFKNVNDVHGHAAGDIVLKEIAALLMKSIRQNDFISRYGGEEFVIVMPGMPIWQALERMETCRKEIEKTVIEYGDKKITLTISGGISHIKNFTETYDELLKSADDALYYSKSHGRNRITTSSPQFNMKETL